MVITNGQGSFETVRPNGFYMISGAELDNFGKRVIAEAERAAEAKYSNATMKAERADMARDMEASNKECERARTAERMMQSKLARIQNANAIERKRLEDKIARMTISNQPPLVSGDGYRTIWKEYSALNSEFITLRNHYTQTEAERVKAVSELAAAQAIARNAQAAAKTMMEERDSQQRANLTLAASVVKVTAVRDQLKAELDKHVQANVILSRHVTDLARERDGAMKEADALRASQPASQPYDQSLLSTNQWPEIREIFRAIGSMRALQRLRGGLDRGCDDWKALNQARADILDWRHNARAAYDALGKLFPKDGK